MLRGTAAGVLPGLAASAAIQELGGGQPNEAKLAETALATSALTKPTSALFGAGAAPIADTLLPIYAGVEVGDKVTQGLEAVLPQDMNPIGKSTLEGGASGAAGGATYGLTAAGQSMAANAISQGVAAMSAPR